MFFRTWLETADCPWYVKDQYLNDNSRKLRGVVAPEKRAAQVRPNAHENQAETEVAGGTSVEAREEDEQEEATKLVDSDTEESSEEEQKPQEDTHVLRMLYKGNMEEVNRRTEQARKARVISQKHSFYKQTRCTSVAQEEQSALPAGVVNVNEDSSDEEDYFGEQKEIAKELQELQAAKHWINQEGWDVAGEGRAISPSTGEEIDLRLDWADVKRKLAAGAGADAGADPARVDEAVVCRDYALEKLDPTQRVFANLVLAWAGELVRIHKEVGATGKRHQLPKLRTWLARRAAASPRR